MPLTNKEKQECQLMLKEDIKNKKPKFRSGMCDICDKYYSDVFIHYKSLKHQYKEFNTYKYNS